MKQCEKCLNEHNGTYGSSRFCSAKCSRSFSTSKNRQEINLKVSNKMKGRPAQGKPFAIGDGRKRGGGKAFTHIYEYPSGATAYTKAFNCLNCQKVWYGSYGSKNFFCSQKCQHELVWKNKKIKIEANELMTSGAIRRFLVERNYACSECGISEWRYKPISLHMHHEDGNNSNNILSNCSLLCLNCHSQTHNFCSKGLSKKLPKQDPKSIYFRNWYRSKKTMSS